MDKPRFYPVWPPASAHPPVPICEEGEVFIDYKSLYHTTVLVLSLLLALHGRVLSLITICLW